MVPVSCVTVVPVSCVTVVPVSCVSVVPVSCVTVVPVSCVSVVPVSCVSVVPVSCVSALREAHPGRPRPPSELELLPSGRRFRTPDCRLKRNKNSVISCHHVTLTPTVLCTFCVFFVIVSAVDDAVKHVLLSILCV